MKIAVTAFPRTKQGTGASRRLRTSGRVPGIVYGANQAAQTVEFDHAAMLRHLKLEAFHASILDLTVDGVTSPALLRDFQMHPFKPLVLHVDMQRVDKNQKIHMRIPLHFVNADISVGVKVGGGAVQHVMSDIDIQCLPDDLPAYIEVDVKDLQVNHSLHVNDLQLPKGVEPIARLKNENPTVVTVQVVKEAAAESGEAGPAVTEITGQKPEAAAAGGDKKDAAAGGDKKEAAPAAAKK
ncbi:MAG: 50S ribosomal protein L25/general stress protein Ctc [Betaproteobacteria bacterium]|nr:50S ribosomal protein L25/general stress protein Ctc [Betaproteobacteria bacterium]